MIWKEYEKRKKELLEKNLSNFEYEKSIKEILKQMENDDDD